MNFEEINDLYDYDMKISQNKKYFKFSIDSILLAEFIKLHKDDKSILDLCTGNAPIPLILNRKYGNKLKITGVELQKEIFDLAQRSIILNEACNIELINDNIKNVKYPHKYDIISCNPPYFKIESESQMNKEEIKAIARHEIMINLEEIISIASKNIKNKGYFYLIHRPERLVEIINLLHKYRFGVKEIRIVHNDINSPACLILISAIFNGEDYVIINHPVILSDYQSYQNIFGK